MKKYPKNGFVLWFTWLSWAWKTTIADALHKRLIDEWYINLERLDWDIIREHLTKDLWFSKEDRALNLERVWFVSEILSRNNVWVLATFISPYKEDRVRLKNRCTNFIEVFINTPLEVCEERDVKWLYAKARKGEIKNFTGISDPYEDPVNPDIELFTHLHSVEESVEMVCEYLVRKFHI